MVKGLDELVDFAVERIALCGTQGESNKLQHTPRSNPVVAMSSTCSLTLQTRASINIELGV